MTQPPARRTASSKNKKNVNSKTTAPKLRTPEERRASYEEFLSEPTPQDPVNGLSVGWEHMKTSKGWK